MAPSSLDGGYARRREPAVPCPGDSGVFGYITQAGFATAQADQTQMTAITEGSVTVQ